ncbi:MAG TPA: RidA family protein [Terriglobales bacterium]|nr:RidA family protein [Terriglobales bacterium]
MNPSGFTLEFPRFLVTRRRTYQSEEIYEAGDHSRRAAGDLPGKIQGPASTVTKHGDTIYVSGAPPFDPKTGEIFKGPIERQTEIVLDQLKLCVETAGSSLENILKLNVYVTSVDMFPAVNAVYRRYFPENPRASLLMFLLGTAGLILKWIVSPPFYKSAL